MGRLNHFKLSRSTANRGCRVAFVVVVVMAFSGFGMTGLSEDKRSTEGASHVGSYAQDQANIVIFVEKTGAENPVDLVGVDYLSKPAFVDIDNDDDLDLFVANAGYFAFEVRL